MGSTQSQIFDLGYYFDQLQTAQKSSSYRITLAKYNATLDKGTIVKFLQSRGGSY